MQLATFFNGVLEMELFLFCQTLCEEGLLECREAAKPRELGLFDDVFEEEEDPFRQETLVESYCYGMNAATEYCFFPTDAAFSTLTALFQCLLSSTNTTPNSLEPSCKRWARLEQRTRVLAQPDSHTQFLFHRLLRLQQLHVHIGRKLLPSAHHHLKVLIRRLAHFPFIRALLRQQAHILLLEHTQVALHHLFIPLECLLLTFSSFTHQCVGTQTEHEPSFFIELAHEVPNVTGGVKSADVIHTRIC